LIQLGRSHWRFPHCSCSLLEECAVAIARQRQYHVTVFSGSASQTHLGTFLYTVKRASGSLTSVLAPMPSPAVPKIVKPRFDEVVGLTDSVCRTHLTDEYAA
jgi:hypothetical protein